MARQKGGTENRSRTSLPAPFSNPGPRHLGGVAGQEMIHGLFGGQARRSAGAPESVGCERRSVSWNRTHIVAGIGMKSIDMLARVFSARLPSSDRASVKPDPRRHFRERSRSAASWRISRLASSDRRIIFAYTALEIEDGGSDHPCSSCRSGYDWHRQRGCLAGSGEAEKIAVVAVRR